MTHFLEKLNLVLVFLILLSVIPFSKTRPGHKNLPRCKQDEDILRSDKLIPFLLSADYIFTGKVASAVQIFGDMVVFDVSVQKCFKDSGVFVNQTFVKVVKHLRDGEGTTCRSVVRKKLTAIFVGTLDGNFLGDVRLSVSPVPVTLANLDRVSSVVKGHKCLHIETKAAAHGNGTVTKSIDSEAVKVCACNESATSESNVKMNKLKKKRHEMKSSLRRKESPIPSPST